jgi:hypothetical protein
MNTSVFTYHGTNIEVRVGDHVRLGDIRHQRVAFKLTRREDYAGWGLRGPAILIEPHSIMIAWDSSDLEDLALEQGSTA